MSEGYLPNGALLFNKDTLEYPQAQHTVLFSKQGGPLFYINLHDNGRFHLSHYIEDGMYVYGDTCFAKVVGGLDFLQQILSMKDGVGLLSSAVHIVDSQVVNVRDYKGIEIVETK